MAHKFNLNAERHSQKYNFSGQSIVSRKTTVFKISVEILKRKNNYLQKKIMKTLKLKKDIVERLSTSESKKLKGGTLLSDIPTVCVSALGSCLPSCKGLTCNIAPCDPDPTTVRPPCKDISVVEPGHTLVNCLVTRQTCAC